MDLAALNDALVGRYRIQRELGAGGMAIVYLARDLRHDRDVAIKVLRPELVERIGSARFFREVRLAAGLDHPNILTLIDSGEANGICYYVLPFVDGESLRDKLSRERRLDLDDAVRIASEIGAALQYAHERGVVHRDVKPENILLGNGRARLGDFGIALITDTVSDRLTETGISLGTPAYMSPEQAAGERTLDARSDVFSLGATVYEMITGEPAFSGGSAKAVVARILTEAPMNPRLLRPSVSDNMATTILTALERDPTRRFATATAFSDALKSYLSDGRSVGPTTRTRRSRIVVAMLCLGALALAIPARVVWNNSRAIIPSPVSGTSPSITVRYDSMPLRTVVADLVRRGGPRVVLGPGGDSVLVTAAFTEQPADAVLRAILTTHQFELANDASAGVLVATMRHVPAPASIAPPVSRTVVVALHYRRAADLQPIVAVSLTDRGRIVADTLTNSLVITEASSLIGERIRFANDLDNAVAHRRSGASSLSSATDAAPRASQPPADGLLPVPAGKHRIAILAFANGSVGRLASELLPLRFVISDLLMAEFASDSTLQVVEADASGTSVDAAAPFIAATAGQHVGAETAIIGSYVGDASGRLRLSAHVVDVQARRVTHTEILEARQDTVLAAVQTIAHRLLCDLQTGRQSACTPAKALRIKLDVATMKMYSNALDELDRGHNAEAARLLQLVVSKFPDFAPARTNLQRAGGRPVP